MPEKSAPAPKEQLLAFFAVARTRAGEGRVLPAAGQARDHADQPAQHLHPHAADPAGHSDAARRDHGDRRGPQGTGARRRARRRGSRDAARAARRAWRRPCAARSAARCAGWRGFCAAIRPRPSARCGRRWSTTAASPAAASSARRRSGRTSATSSRFRCGVVIDLVPADEDAAAAQARADKRAWLAERGYEIIETVAEIEADMAGSLEQIARHSEADGRSEVADRRRTACVRRAN